MNSPTPTTDSVDTIAAVDIGTNSFHLVVARSTEPGRFEVIAREKEMVRLGSGEPDMRELDDDAIERGVVALRRMRQVAEIHGADLYAVATSAVREAENSRTFVKRAQLDAGVKVEVISGLEEARLIYLGILQALPVFEKRTVLIDIGGGSTEVLVGQRGEVLTAGSLKLGAIRITRRFFRTDLLHPAALDTSRRFVRAAMAPMAREVRSQGFDVAVGSSGTIESVAEVIRSSRTDRTPSPRTLNGFEFTRDEVVQAVHRLAEAPTVLARLAIRGVDERRADIVLGGAVILEQAMLALGIERMLVSDYALREGVLLDVLQRRRGSARHHLRDLRRKSVEHLADLMDSDRRHSSNVARLALSLFDQTSVLGLHDLSDESRELLEAAALLCNVGTFVSHDKHHKHSYYVIRNTDHLMGFTDPEIELIALVARYHRKGEPKAGHSEFSVLTTEDQQRVRTLAGFLRLATGLDRTHGGLVAAVNTNLRGSGEDRHLRIEATPRGATDDLSLEMYTAIERRALLEEVLRLPIDLRAVGIGAPPRK